MNEERKNAFIGAAACLLIGLVVAAGAIIALVTHL